MHLMRLLIMLLLCINTSDSVAKKKPYKKITKPTSSCVLKPGKVVICIHGTLIPHFIRPLVYFALGPAHSLVPFHSLPFLHNSIGKPLNESNKDDFPADALYLYRWPGDLDFESRKKAAEILFQMLSSHKGEIDILAHSHGCNVALNLANFFDEKSTLRINKLILLAPPVQKVTEGYMLSPIFKRVYSFYSTADLTQVIDPQGLYSETKKSSNGNAAFWSKRVFSDHHSLLQARILFNKQSPGHTDFMSQRFLKQLPTLIDLLEKTHAKTKGRHFCINIPSKQNPVCIDRTELAHAYIPRTKRSCRCGIRRPLVA